MLVDRRTLSLIGRGEIDTRPSKERGKQRDYDASEIHNYCFTDYVRLLQCEGRRQDCGSQRLRCLPPSNEAAKRAYFGPL